MKVPFYTPYIGQEEIDEVTSAIQSNWLTKGQRTKKFEESFAVYVGSKHALGLNSCTAGLHLAQKVLGIGEGDQVITTPYTFAATVNTILHCGAEPVFVDIDPLTMNIDPQEIEKAITPKTKAIIPVHFAGFPCEMDRIMEIARRHNVKVIEDAAHAVYTKFHDRLVGSIGDITCFSFYATKNLCTGEGGMITSDDEELMNELQVLSLHGMSKNAWNRYSDKGTWFYEIESPGYKYNMTDIQASLGIVQLGKLEEMQTLRKKVADQYQTFFSKVEQLQVPHDDPKHRHAWHLYPIRLKGDTLKIGRDEFIEKLKEAGIGTSVHFIPIPIHPFYKKLGYKITDFHHTLKAYEGVISLPLFPGMTEKQTEYVIQQVLNLVDQYKK
ncbi:DegT/DnrJ/EryC1/StrS family aminotransferase [Mesobacillus selenatarsenatis]|uniref:Bacillosamine/Legionaminic acid biosynthesis aminotransferase PglE/4-keto-6-deoxy-N-acetyl-D-hexosaminyl-(Lipid carrier) aminotransferase n=1 Tax=Mesobacillus selenatarsenatis (strain DSM 18680 / JCM 14380 / FERM P-15431 / SF-1) TaxID=1321606 RepID=A0A0A8X686_MESS1|nr:DegT/DnrJ/EryC1/StrS family aminotransferase [Mesobacillus selenatarsenatis]GAM15403.1 Bacillosamine/Legionaminic acid biosynthesis aminotransferase PglE/4-keto-6-deoxy-N-acetyl-D-hexosaminyl-(lipid carrier) aminotransferase [Mesobacillus selenatarsenatis SF-1]